VITGIPTKQLLGFPSNPSSREWSHPLKYRLEV